MCRCLEPVNYILYFSCPERRRNMDFANAMKQENKFTRTENGAVECQMKHREKREEKHD